jgi:uncharacterized membrane protein
MKMTRRWMVALALSLGLNLFFAGFAAARHWRAHHALGQRGRGAHRLDDEHGRDASSARERWAVPALRRVWREHRQEFDAELQELRRARQRVMEELGRDTFDKAAVEHALAELRRHDNVLQQKLHHTLVESSAGLPADERRKLRGGGPRDRERGR